MVPSNCLMWFACYYVVLVCLRAVDCQANGSETTSIYLRRNHTEELRMTLARGQNVAVHMEGFNATNLRCVNQKYITMSGKRDIHYSVFWNGETSVVIPNVTDSMNARWRCQVYEIHPPAPYTVQAFYLMVTVLGAKQIDITVNGQEMSPERSADSGAGVNGTAHYSYAEGEVVEYSCEDPFDRRLRLMYYDRNGTQIFATEREYQWSDTKLVFRAALRREHSGAYVDCACAAPDHRYLHRTYFTLGERHFDGEEKLLVTVNGLELVPQADVNNTLQYTYRYAKLDNLTVTCEKTSNLTSGVLAMDWLTPADDIANVSASGAQWKQQALLKFVESEYDGRVLRCALANGTARPAHVRLQPLDNNSKYRDMNIVGLREDRVQYVFEHNATQWRTVYRYELGEQLALTCFVYFLPLEDKAQWNFAGNDVEAPNLNYVQYKLPSIKITRVIFGQFALGAEHDGGELACQAGALRHVVELRLQPAATTGSLLLEQVRKLPLSFMSLIPVVGTALMLALGGAAFCLCRRACRGRGAPDQQKISSDIEFTEPASTEVDTYTK